MPNWTIFFLLPYTAEHCIHSVWSNKVLYVLKWLKLDFVSMIKILHECILDYNII